MGFFFSAYNNQFFVGIQVGETLLRLFVDETSDPTQTSDTLDGLKEQDTNVLYADFPNLEQKGSDTNKVLSTPAVRSLAKQYGVNIGDVLGTGKDGRVLREDVISYASKKGIFKEIPTIMGGHSKEQSLAEDNNDTGIFEDKTVTLRYAPFFGGEGGCG